ncbi:MAG: ERCC4 domain-containing protein, partial [Candidatus Thermoplasmatota archaeon]|nr:ERCC4 domain-containing protein [Candidatus Thermoplasmatota archaeon]
ASPGSTAARINEVCKNIGVENVEIRTENDPDVKPYVQNVHVEWLEVEMPEDVRRVSKLLRESMNSRISALQSAGFVPGHVRPERITVRDLLNSQTIIQSKIREMSPNPPSALFQAVAVSSAAMKISHAVEMAETQGIPALRSYFARLGEDQSKGASMLRSDPKFSDAILIAKQLNIDRVDHPKVERLTGILLDQLGRKADSRIIVFSQYRDTVEMLLSELAKNQAIRAVKFIGQASRGDDNGMSQKKQMETIEKFRANDFNVLVSTSIGEEGLDIPQVDMVIFYEPVPSEIRSIQRRGRTGRKRPGRVVVLMTKDTRDEAYYWSGKAKEQRMKDELAILREEMRKQNIVRAFREKEAQAPHAVPSEKKGQLTLGEFERAPKPQAPNLYAPTQPAAQLQNTPAPQTPSAPPKPAQPSNPHQIRIITDTREFNSGVARDLLRAGAFVEPKQLEVGDYVLSDRCCAERKESNDFVQSIIDGRLFEQMVALKNAYRRPIVIIEGPDIVTVRNMSPMSIYSAVASISVDFGIPILQTRDAKETANLLYAIARREQTDEKRDIAIRGEKGQMSLAERQQFIIESLPDISSVLAKRLLCEFGTVKRIIGAKPEALQRVEGIGPITAEKITKAINESYESENKE